MKRAITNAIIFTVNEQDRIIRNGTVIIDGEKITAVWRKLRFPRIQMR
mgnify:CR=1 FL=1